MKIADFLDIKIKFLKILIGKVIILLVLSFSKTFACNFFFEINRNEALIRWNLVDFAQFREFGVTRFYLKSCFFNNSLIFGKFEVIRISGSKVMSI